MTKIQPIYFKDENTFLRLEEMASNENRSLSAMACIAIEFLWTNRQRRLAAAVSGCANPVPCEQDTAVE